MPTFQRLALAASTVLAFASVSTGAAQAAALAFDAPQKLPTYVGPEPSIAFDPSGNGRVYVVAPQSIPAVGNVGSEATNGRRRGEQGVAVFASRDGGRTFSAPVLTGAAIGGGDSDVEVGLDHTVFVADLELAASAICTSKNEGRSFPNCAGGVAPNQQGPIADRPFLARGPKNELYLSYTNAAAGLPTIVRSDDGGQTFRPCGNVVDPGGPAANTFKLGGNTLVTKPVVGPDGTLYLEFSTSDGGTEGSGANHLYMAVAQGGCTGNTQFKNFLIYENPGASLGNIFQFAAIDAAGHLYVTAAGKTKQGRDSTDVFLFVSRDRGRAWSPPVQVNPPNLKANVLPTVVGGQAGDEVALGWFGSEVSGDANDKKSVWRYYAATSFSGGESFDISTVTPDPVHYQDICTMGTGCGDANRNLADFSSAAVDPSTGCVTLAFPGDPENNRPGAPARSDDHASSAFVARQGGGRCLAPSGPPGAGQTNQVCGDRAAPRSSITRGSLRRSRRGISLRGQAIDRACQPANASGTDAGHVARVRVSVARRSHGRCRFLTRSGRFSRLRPCTRPIELSTSTRQLPRSSQTRWSFRKRVRLAPGRYVVATRAIDAVGHQETRSRHANTIGFTVR